MMAFAATDLNNDREFVIYPPGKGLSDFLTLHERYGIGF